MAVYPPEIYLPIRILRVLRHQTFVDRQAPTILRQRASEVTLILENRADAVVTPTQTVLPAHVAQVLLC